MMYCNCMTNGNGFHKVETKDGFCVRCKYAARNTKRQNMKTELKWNGECSNYKANRNKENGLVFTEPFKILK